VVEDQSRKKEAAGEEVDTKDVKYSGCISFARLYGELGR
jgi:hypothetical protein